MVLRVRSCPTAYRGGGQQSSPEDRRRPPRQPTRNGQTHSSRRASRVRRSAPATSGMLGSRRPGHATILSLTQPRLTQFYEEPLGGYPWTYPSCVSRHPACPVRPLDARGGLDDTPAAVRPRQCRPGLPAAPRALLGCPLPRGRPHRGSSGGAWSLSSHGHQESICPSAIRSHVFRQDFPESRSLILSCQSGSLALYVAINLLTRGSA